MLMVPRTGTKAHLTVRINAKVRDRLVAYSKRKGRTKSELVDRAVEEGLDRVEIMDQPAKITPKR